MEVAAKLALNLAKSKAKSVLLDFQKSRADNPDAAVTQLDHAVISSLSEALLDRLDSLNLKIDALARAPIRSAQSHLNTGFNALNAQQTERANEYFHHAYTKAQDGFHQVTTPVDKITAGRIACVAAVFAFRDSIPLMLTELRLRYIDILSDCNVQSMLNSYHAIATDNSNYSFRKMWTTNNQLLQYRTLLFELVQLYHLLTTQLHQYLPAVAWQSPDNLSQSQPKQASIEFETEEKQLSIEQPSNPLESTISIPKNESTIAKSNSNRSVVKTNAIGRMAMVSSKKKSPFSSGVWILTGVPSRVYLNAQSDRNKTIAVHSNAKVPLSVAESLQKIQQILQNILSTELFGSADLTIPQYNQFYNSHRNEISNVLKHCRNSSTSATQLSHQLSSNVSSSSSSDQLLNNEMIFNILLIASRGLSSLPNLTRVGKRSMILHAAAMKHWDLCEFLCRFYLSSVWQISNANGWTILTYACIENKIDLIKVICQLWTDECKDNNQWRNTPQLQQFDLINYKADGDIPILSFCHTIDAMEILLSHGADINIQSNCGETILMCCVKRNRSAELRYLLTMGANANIIERTPLRRKASDSSSNEPKMKCRTALMIATERKMSEMVDAFLSWFEEKIAQFKNASIVESTELIETSKQWLDWTIKNENGDTSADLIRQMFTNDKELLDRLDKVLSLVTA